MSPLQILREHARDRGLTLSDVIQELQYEVHQANRDDEDLTARVAGIHLFGAFYDPKVHVHPMPDHLAAEVEDELVMHGEPVA